MVKLKWWYLSFLEKNKRNAFELSFYCFLYLLSLIYGFGVRLRNFFYNKKVIPSYSCRAKVISIGNLSWSGSGKTSLSIWLHRRLSSEFKVAILRRGYGNDEGKLLGEITKNVFSFASRHILAKRLERLFDIFILDDGFQHRKLRRDVNIVVMGAREFRRKHRLIPAYFFREPLSALRRADMLLLNYKEEIEDIEEIKKSILNIAPHLEVYFSCYKFKRFIDLDGKEYSLDFFKGKKLAAFTAIGYPEGFLNKLKELKLDIVRKIVYPDHYELRNLQFKAIQDSLIKVGINDLIITHKDKYHFPNCEIKLNIFIMEVEMEIENEDNFMRGVKIRLQGQK